MGDRLRNIITFTTVLTGGSLLLYTRAQAFELIEPETPPEELQPGVGRANINLIRDFNGGIWHEIENIGDEKEIFYFFSILAEITNLRVDDEVNIDKIQNLDLFDFTQAYSFHPMLAKTDRPDREEWSSPTFIYDEADQDKILYFRESDIGGVIGRDPLTPHRRGSMVVFELEPGQSIGGYVFPHFFWVEKYGMWESIRRPVFSYLARVGRYSVEEDNRITNDHTLIIPYLGPLSSISRIWVLYTDDDGFIVRSPFPMVTYSDYEQRQLID